MLQEGGPAGAERALRSPQRAAQLAPARCHWEPWTQGSREAGHLLYLWRGFSSGAPHTPRSAGLLRQPAHARKPHFYRQPSPWLSQPALTTTRETDDTHVSVSSPGLSPDFRPCIWLPRNTSTGHLLGTSPDHGQSQLFVSLRPASLSLPWSVNADPSSQLLRPKTWNRL